MLFFYTYCSYLISLIAVSSLITNKLFSFYNFLPSYSFYFNKPSFCVEKEATVKVLSLPR